MSKRSNVKTQQKNSQEGARLEPPHAHVPARDSHLAAHAAHRLRHLRARKLHMHLRLHLQRLLLHEHAVLARARRAVRVRVRGERRKRGHLAKGLAPREERGARGLGRLQHEDALRAGGARGLGFGGLGRLGALEPEGLEERALLRRGGRRRGGGHGRRRGCGRLELLRLRGEGGRGGALRDGREREGGVERGCGRGGGGAARGEHVRAAVVAERGEGALVLDLGRVLRDGRVRVLRARVRREQGDEALQASARVGLALLAGEGCGRVVVVVRERGAERPARLRGGAGGEAVGVLDGEGREREGGERLGDLAAVLVLAVGVFRRRGGGEAQVEGALDAARAAREARRAGGHGGRGERECGRAGW